MNELTLRCRKVGQIISAYLDSEATQSEWQEAKAHIKDCSHCTQTFIDFLKIKVLCKELAKKQFEPSSNLWTRIADCIERAYGDTVH